MGLLNWLFGKKEVTSSEDLASTPDIKNTVSEVKTIKEVPISEVKVTAIPEGSSVVAESTIPEFCSIGNLVYEKKYAEAVELGLKLLEESPNDCDVHINLMDAYFKGKEIVANDYIEKSSYHAKQAILLGHNTGYAEERLAKNLDKAKKYHQSLQSYNLILETEDFHFSRSGCGNGIDWNHRREAILKKMDKAVDSESDILFTPSEIKQIIQSIKDNDDRERMEKERYDRIMKEIDMAIQKGEHEKCDRLFKELHNPID